MHCRIDGPAAYDVLANFEERWLKASKPHGLKKLKNSYDDALLRIERMPDIMGVHDAPCLSENDPEGWHVQVHCYVSIKILVCNHSHQRFQIDVTEYFNCRFSVPLILILLGASLRIQKTVLTR